MAYRINLRCTGCADCLPVCPAKAILAPPPAFRIHPLLCAECLGFADEPQCVKVCEEDALEQLRPAENDRYSKQ
ncbi:MAG: ferredoxin [bacterium]|nr:ferredoxin [bacterium]